MSAAFRPILKHYLARNILLNMAPFLPYTREVFLNGWQCGKGRTIELLVISLCALWISRLWSRLYLTFSSICHISICIVFAFVIFSFQRQHLAGCVYRVYFQLQQMFECYCKLVYSLNRAAQQAQVSFNSSVTHTRTTLSTHLALFAVIVTSATTNARLYLVYPICFPCLWSTVVPFMALKVEVQCSLE